MKSAKKHTAKVPTKGARLKWEPLKSVRPVHLTAQMLQGRLVEVKSSNRPPHYLVP